MVQGCTQRFRNKFTTSVYFSVMPLSKAQREEMEGPSRGEGGGEGAAAAAVAAPARPMHAEPPQPPPAHAMAPPPSSALFPSSQAVAYVAPSTAILASHGSHAMYAPSGTVHHGAPWVAVSPSPMSGPLGGAPSAGAALPVSGVAHAVPGQAAAILPAIPSHLAPQPTVQPPPHAAPAAVYYSSAGGAPAAVLQQQMPVQGGMFVPAGGAMPIIAPVAYTHYYTSHGYPQQAIATTTMPHAMVQQQPPTPSEHKDTDMN